ncbi:MAG: phosphoribosylformylglycinamidine synthase subunit PurS [Spirochaetia bacterium]|nr:phosphoribosylformylglycinamidine synthase subunit PurS [Spirochaetota bacterium]MCX8096904.1 phosphoribosylformylglycinamidine synthase subunit PurS [Spirochaetota bacterium]MDW8112455.1 phosphoribosylformylglycinamidine synthase subunit PurS [Spirochaetia bacterium]
MKYRINVFLKNNVFDPQGNAIMRVLHNLGYKSVNDVRVGKVFLIDISEDSENIIKKISEDVFSNPVIEKFEIEKLEG